MDTVGYLLIAVALSAFFSGMAVSFASMDKVRFEMVGKSQWNARIVALLLHHSASFRSSMLVGSHIALVAYGLLAARLLEEILPVGAISNQSFC